MSYLFFRTQVTQFIDILFHTLSERRLSMGTNLRTTLSKKNPYYISKHRRLELVHFCLQYPEWKSYLSSIRIPRETEEFADPTSEEAIKRIIFSRNIDLVEQSAKIAGGEIWEYLLRAVTHGDSYVLLSTKYFMPCSKDYFYDRYHKFWFILSQKEHMF